MCIFDIPICVSIERKNDIELEKEKSRNLKSRKFWTSCPSLNHYPGEATKSGSWRV